MSLFPAPPPAASTPFSFFLILMRVHRVRTNANTCGYDVLYQNTVLHLSCHELYVAHLVCLGLRYVTLVFFLYYVYNEERRMINREIRSSYAIQAKFFRSFLLSCMRDHQLSRFTRKWCKYN